MPNCRVVEAVQLSEIRPSRPNQDVILPGMLVRGKGVKFEVKKDSILLVVYNTRLQKINLEMYSIYDA